MIVVWYILLTIGGSAYLALLSMIIIGLIKLKYSKEDYSLAKLQVSIVIAARDEEMNLPSTLQGLLDQEYPHDLMEIIVVDDRSSDRTAEIVSGFSRTDKRIRLLKQTSIITGVSPKKQALDKGIKASTGEVILTTDADCRHLPDWIREMTSGMVDNVGMVVGQTRFILPGKPPLWQRLQALDFQSLGYASAGLIRFGMPFTYSGASLAFRRKLFDEVKGWEGYEKLISGDDELLMAKASRSRWGIKAATSPASIVSSLPVGSLKELWNQRIRWGSKGLYYRPSRKIILAGVFIYLLTMTAGPVVWLLSGVWAYWLLWAVIRFLLDGFALVAGASVFREEIKISEFLMLELIYPPLTVLFAIAGHFTSFEWKEQTFRSRGIEH